MTASRLEIINRALSRIGAARISSLDEGSREANVMKASYDIVRRAELQRNLWTFAVKRVEIAADAATPAFGRGYSFTVPADFLRPTSQDPRVANLPTDYLYEGRQILTDDPGPLQLRYVSMGIPEEQQDPLFDSALAAALAVDTVEELTQSSSKRRELSSDYGYHIQQAKSANSVLAGPQLPDIDEWVYVRTFGEDSQFGVRSGVFGGI